MMHVGKSSLLLDGKIGSRKYKIINATYWLSHIFCHHCQITQGTGDLHTSKTTRRKTSKVWLTELFMKNRPFSLYLKSGKILHCSEFPYKTRFGTSIYSKFLSTCITIGKLFVQFFCLQRKIVLSGQKEELLESLDIVLLPLYSVIGKYLGLPSPDEGKKAQRKKKEDGTSPTKK